MNQATQLVIPMTGVGQRFVDRGYSDIKPLIQTGIGSMLSGVLRNFQTDEFRTNLSNSEIQKEISKVELELKQNIYIHKALSLYYKWLLANKKLEIRESILKIALERQGMLEKKFKAGDVEKLKLVDNERSIEKRKDELLKSQIEWLDIKTQLEIYYRNSNGEPHSLVKNTLPQDVPKEIFETSAGFEELPQIKIINREIKIFENNRNLFKQSRLPGLQLEVLGARELSANDPYDPEALQVGLKFDFPLENRKAQGKTVSAEYKYLALKKKRDYLVLKLKQQFDYSLTAQRNGLLRWKTTSNEFQKTTDLSNAERKRWAQGASDLYIVNLREQDTADADIKRWNIWYDYHQSILDTKLFSGKIRPD
jgi:outer membrane protein TolC